MKNIAFGPASITIPVGSIVNWTNLDAVSHTASGVGGLIDTGVIEQGQEQTVTFSEAAEFEYICAFHPNMTGTVIVE